MARGSRFTPWSSSANDAKRALSSQTSQVRRGSGQAGTRPNRMRMIPTFGASLPRPQQTDGHGHNLVDRGTTWLRQNHLDLQQPEKPPRKLRISATGGSFATWTGAGARSLHRPELVTRSDPRSAGFIRSDRQGRRRCHQAPPHQYARHPLQHDPLLLIGLGITTLCQRRPMRSIVCMVLRFIHLRVVDSVSS